MQFLLTIAVQQVSVNNLNGIQKFKVHLQNSYLTFLLGMLFEAAINNTIPSSILGLDISW